MNPTRGIRIGVGGITAAVVATAVLTATGLTLLRSPTGDAPTAVEAPAAPAKEMWQCPMHPTIVQDHAGDCPICGMKLLKVDSVGDEHAGHASAETPEGLTTVTIDPARQQLIGLKLAHVERARVAGSWRTTGRVAVDETRVHHVNVKFSGFIEHVHGDFIGRPVTKGEPLFAIYSPELLAAQEEYVLALRTQSKLDRGEMARDGAALVAAARRKLELLDVPESQIRTLAKTGEPSRTVTIYSPATGVLTKKDVVPGMRVNAGDMPFEIVDLSHVWVLADAYESDLAQVAVGMRATLTLKAFPNRAFHGQVTFIDPLLDPKTRTAKVRIEFPNEGGELRPEMFGEVVLQGEGHEGLRVPADAVIQSGTQSVVFVTLGNGKFQPREIQLGTGDSQYVEVIAGLDEGDAVVTRANFLIDSESRLRASLAALSSGEAAKSDPPGEASDPHAGHRR